MRRLTTAGRLLACAVLLLACAQAHAKEWRRIVPLRSTRAQVERRLGKPRNGFYELKAERVFIYFSGERCAGGEGWDVPRDTVVRIVVTPTTKLRFAALRLNLRRFEKTTDPSVTAHALYSDKEAGLTYTVYEGGGDNNGVIVHITFDPTARDARLVCRRTD